MASPEVEDMLPLLENENWVKVGSLGQCWCIYQEMKCPIHVIIYEFIIYIYICVCCWEPWYHDQYESVIEHLV